MYVDIYRYVSIYINIYIYINFGGSLEVYGSHYIFLLIIHKNGKITYIKIKFYIFCFNNFFLMLNDIKVSYDNGGGGTQFFLLSENSSNWYHSNTANSRHLFNANMYMNGNDKIYASTFLVSVKLLTVHCFCIKKIYKK